MQSIPEGGWNIFARVLQEILAVRGLGLGHLDDRAYVHPERVRRLKRSLTTPKSLPMLTIEELDVVIRVFKLTRQEKLRLRAAVLTTSIEVTLMDRIDHYDAFKAAEQILPIIEQTLRDHADEHQGLALARKEKAMTNEEDEIDYKLNDALTAVDRATLALHLSRNVETQSERVERLRQAQTYFETALAELDAADTSLKVNAIWQIWHDEADKGLSSVKKRLVSLGG